MIYFVCLLTSCRLVIPNLTLESVHNCDANVHENANKHHLHLAICENFVVLNVVLKTSHLRLILARTIVRLCVRPVIRLVHVTDRKEKHQGLETWPR